jgi:hypothetical protein
LQGEKVMREDDNLYINLFQGVLCLFLLEMGMTASRKLKDLRTAGPAFIFYGLLAPNLFATIGITLAHVYAHLTHTHFLPGTYVHFAVLCGAASYIAVPAVQRLAIPEASPTLPLAASLGLIFSYNVTIGVPVYIEIANALMERFPVGSLRSSPGRHRPGTTDHRIIAGPPKPASRVPASISRRPPGSIPARRCHRAGRPDVAGWVAGPASLRISAI